MSQEFIQGYRLSPQQRRLWLLRQFDHAAWCAVRTDGELNVETLRRAIHQVVSQQEILRTTFKLLPGMTIPVQVISDEPDVVFTIHDLTQLSADEQESRIKTLCGEIADRKIDLQELPLF